MMSLWQGTGSSDRAGTVGMETHLPTGEGRARGLEEQGAGCSPPVPPCTTEGFVLVPFGRGRGTALVIHEVNLCTTYKTTADL